jgi:hypothetical protein
MGDENLGLSRIELMGKELIQARQSTPGLAPSRVNISFQIAIITLVQAAAGIACTSRPPHRRFPAMPG